MTDKTEEQPEALRLDESKRYSDVVHHANVKASIAYVARKTGLGYQETERLLELALQRGDLTEGDYSGRKMEKIADDRLASLEAQLVAQTNRAAAAEQQRDALLAAAKVLLDGADAAAKANAVSGNWWHNGRAMARRAIAAAEAAKNAGGPT